MSIEVTMRHSDVRIEALKAYAELRMVQLKAKFPKVTKVSLVIDVDIKKHMYTAEVVANRLGEVAESGKSVIDAAAARAERQLLRMRVKARKGKVREQRAASAKN